MKLILGIFVCFVCINFVLGGIETIPNAIHKDHPGKCYLSVTNPPTIMQPGDTITISGCQRAICDRKYNVEIHSCAVIQEKKGCKKTDNAATRPYPECCPRMKCN